MNKLISYRVNKFINEYKHKKNVRALGKLMLKHSEGKLTIEETYEKGYLLGINIINTVPDESKLGALMYYESVIKFVNLYLAELTYAELKQRFEGINYDGDENEVVGNNLFDTLTSSDNKMIKRYLLNTFRIFCAVEEIKESM